MKVYSSETNIDVYGSDQSYESESPFEGALQIMSIALKNDLNNEFVVESFIQEIRSKTLIHLVMNTFK